MPVLRARSGLRRPLGRGGDGLVHRSHGPKDACAALCMLWACEPPMWLVFKNVGKLITCLRCLAVPEDYADKWEFR